MDRYLIKSYHTKEECRMVVRHFLQYHASFLAQFDWGCYDHDHHAYAIVEANSHEEAKLAVPPLFREKTEVIRLVHFKPEMLKDDAHVAK